jgi:isopenicillin-N N-acyltransferase-like protein
MFARVCFVVALAWPFSNVCPIAHLVAAEPFHYPPGQSGKGSLRIIDGVPVLHVRGTPQEMGEQLGVLVLKPASGLTKLADGFLNQRGWDKLYPVILKTGGLMRPQFPRDHLDELTAAARASGWSEELLVFGNTIPDLRKLGGCSALIIEPSRSAAGGPLFGRNLDWPPFGPIHEYAFVAVYQPAGKLAFASVTYPGMLGVGSGMNERGLSLADLTVNDANDGSPKLDVTGTPYTLALRRVLEECSTVAEAEKLLRSLKRTTRQNVAICDRQGGAVFEITPRNVVVRTAVEGVCACTNHFRTAALAMSMRCDRYDTLDKSRALAKLNVADVAKQMDAVNQGAWTLQTMVFEPAALKLHVAFGKGPATRLPLHTLDLRALFANGEKRE